MERDAVKYIRYLGWLSDNAFVISNKPSWVEFDWKKSFIFDAWHSFWPCFNFWSLVQLCKLFTWDWWTRDCKWQHVQKLNCIIVAKIMTLNDWTRSERLVFKLLLPTNFNSDEILHEFGDKRWGVVAIATEGIREWIRRNLSDAIVKTKSF